MVTRYPSSLLSHDDFRRGVFARDRGCVICGAQDNLDAHHVLNRRREHHGHLRVFPALQALLMQPHVGGRLALSKISAKAYAVSFHSYKP